MKKGTAILLFICLMAAIDLHAQVGINTDGSNPDPSAMLDVNSANTGLLIPRVALVSFSDAATITNPANTLLVYNTSLGGLSPAGFYFNSGTTTAPNWVQLITGTGSGAGWTTIGNAGTVPGTDFIGTSDNQDLEFRTNNTSHLRLTTRKLTYISLRQRANASVV